MKTDAARKKWARGFVYVFYRYIISQMCTNSYKNEHLYIPTPEIHNMRHTYEYHLMYPNIGYLYIYLNIYARKKKTFIDIEHKGILCRKICKRNIYGLLVGEPDVGGCFCL